MTDVIENMARAMTERDDKLGAWDKITPKIQNWYREMAKAALTALEQPSAEMVEAGCDHNFGPDVTGSDVRGSFDGQIVIQIWSRMIKAARGDQ